MSGVSSRGRISDVGNRFQVKETGIRQWRVLLLYRVYVSVLNEYLNVVVFKPHSKLKGTKWGPANCRWRKSKTFVLNGWGKTRCASATDIVSPSHILVTSVWRTITPAQRGVGSTHINSFTTCRQRDGSRNLPLIIIIHIRCPTNFPTLFDYGSVGNYKYPLTQVLGGRL